MRENYDLEIRFAAPTEDGAIAAMAVPFDVVDTYGTSFAKTAFTGLSSRRIPMLWSHDAAQVIGSWSDFQVTDTGLRAAGKLNLDIARAKEVRSMLAAGDINGVSIGFQTVTSKPLPGGLRAITKAQIYEISLVAMPSVPGAKVTSIRTDQQGALDEFIRAVRTTTSAFAFGESK